MVQDFHFNQFSRPATPQSEQVLPGWALGLRKLYQSVVDQPMPSGFGDLIVRLNRAPEQGSAHRR
jgi:hypothetical protein